MALLDRLPLTQASNLGVGLRGGSHEPCHALSAGGPRLHPSCPGADPEPLTRARRLSAPYLRRPPRSLLRSRTSPRERGAIHRASQRFSKIQVRGSAAGTGALAGAVIGGGLFLADGITWRLAALDGARRSRVPRIDGHGAALGTFPGALIGMRALDWITVRDSMALLLFFFAPLFLGICPLSPSALLQVPTHRPTGDRSGSSRLPPAHVYRARSTSGHARGHRVSRETTDWVIRMEMECTAIA